MKEHRELPKKYIEVVAKNVVSTFVSNVAFSKEESEELCQIRNEQIRDYADKLKQKSYLVKEGVTPSEFEPSPFDDSAMNSGKFNPSAQYCAWIKFKENEESYRLKQMIIIEAMLDFIPPEHLGRVKFIYHPIGTCGPGDLDEEFGTLAWKYIPEKQ